MNLWLISTIECNSLFICLYNYSIYTKTTEKRSFCKFFVSNKWKQLMRQEYVEKIGNDKLFSFVLSVCPRPSKFNRKIHVNQNIKCISKNFLSFSKTTWKKIKSPNLFVGVWKRFEYQHLFMTQKQIKEVEIRKTVFDLKKNSTWMLSIAIYCHFRQLSKL